MEQQYQDGWNPRSCAKSLSRTSHNNLNGTYVAELLVSTSEVNVSSSENIKATRGLLPVISLFSHHVVFLRGPGPYSSFRTLWLCLCFALMRLSGWRRLWETVGWQRCDIRLGSAFAEARRGTAARQGVPTFDALEPSLTNLATYSEPPSLHHTLRVLSSDFEY